MSNIIKSSYVIIQKPKNIKEGARIITPISNSISNSDLIIDEAYAEKESIIEEALEEAKTIVDSANEYKNNVLANVTEEIEKQSKIGFDLGYNEGYEKGLIVGQNNGSETAKKEINEKNEEFVAELCKQIYEVEESKDDILKKFEKDIIKLSIEIAEKIIKTKINKNEDIIKNMINSAIRDYKNSEWVKVYLSSDDYITISTDQNIMKRLSQISDHVNLEVITDATTGELIIETPDNLIDSGVNTQLNNLKDIILGV